MTKTFQCKQQKQQEKQEMKMKPKDHTSIDIYFDDNPFYSSRAYTGKLILNVA